MRFNSLHILKVIALLVVSLVVSTVGVSAQIARPETEDLYGGNPYEAEEEEGGMSAPPEADSTEENKIKKPLESYFFSDSLRALNNISWTIERDYNEIKFNPLDTTLNDWRIDYPIHKEGVGDMALGGLGQASQAIDYAQRSNDFNFSFIQQFDGYTYNMENVPFYNLKTAYTQMNYIEAGQKRYRETNFQIRHAQNISPTTGFNINYKSPGTKGEYLRQDTKNHNLSVAASHTGKRYSIHAGYINNKIETEENGGVVGQWAIVDSIFEMNIGVPMKLENAEAKNIYRNNAMFVEQSYGVPLAPMTDRDFSMANLSAFYVGHSFEYNRWSKTYSDIYATYDDARGIRNEDGSYTTTTHEYYDNWYINPLKSRDTLSESVISNRLFIQAQPWNRDGAVGTINGGVGVDLHSYSQFAMDDYLSARLQKDNKTSWFVYGKVDGRLRDYAKWGANFKLYPSGYRGGDMTAGADIQLAANVAQRRWEVNGEITTSRQSPSYWEQNLFTNHFVWRNNFDTENQTQFKAALNVLDYNLEVGFTQSVVTNKIYYNSESIVSQSPSTISVTALYARKNFKVGGFNFDHRVLWQASTNESVIPVPMISAYLSYYYEFWVVKDVLRLQTGVDGRFTTRYYMPGYNPALSTFYNQREVQNGDYPYMDLYVAGKWKRMRILLKYQHVNDDLFGNGESFAVAGYALNPGVFKMGISWSFYD